MKRTWGIFGTVLFLVAAAGPARAQKASFDDLAKGAEEIRNPNALAALFWAHSADCSKLPDDLAKRQCDGVRRARLAQVAASTFLVAGDPAALQVGQYDAKQKGVPIKVAKCIACASALDIDGAKRFVVGGKGAVAADGPKVKGPEAHAGVQAFKSADAAAKWLERAAPRLRTQFLFRIPTKAETWKSGTVAGFKVDVVGYRVYDPCDGKIVAASPKASDLPADKRYCTGEPVEEEPVAAKPEVKPEPVKPRLPSSLNSNDIKEALAPASEKARKCFEIYGVPGMAHFRITISNEGKVVGLEQLKRSDFVDTPTGECIAKAIKETTFPQSRKKETTVDYPFMLR